MKKLFILALLTGCASHTPIVVAPTETVDVLKPIAKSCVEDVPNYPTLPPVPAKGIKKQVQIKNEREMILRQYSEGLYKAMIKCKELK